MSLVPLNILSFDQRGGLHTNKKPFLIPDQAFQHIENAYAWRDRVLKREGIKLVGRLEREDTFDFVADGNASYTIADVLTTIRADEPDAQINPGTVFITIDAGNPNETIYNDATTNGILTYVSGTYTGAGHINYATGSLTIDFTVVPPNGTTVSITLFYFPMLPVMGIWQREIAAINDEQTIFFDTKYAYTWGGNSFSEFIPGTEWDGTDSDFFWATNYRGINPQDRLFFVTNFINDANNPMRYTDGNTWEDFAPLLSGNQAQDVIIGNISASGTTFTGVIPDAPIIPSSVTITVAGITFTDPTGSGTLTGNPVTNTGTIDYTTGEIVLNFNPTINFTGTITNINGAGDVTTTAPHNLTTGAEITITGVTGSIGSVVNDQSFVITVTGANTFNIGIATPGVYSGGGAWTLTDESKDVQVSYQNGRTFLFSARILIPYFGRLLALNVWEGENNATAVNIFNRCRFSQVGNPVQEDAFRSDVFGKGGFLDAPTNEAIIGATFLNNTLIVFFEKTTWQLRYVGEYGLPFIWERIASDLGSESTFSPILFSQNILAIGDKAIIGATANGVERIDLDIPDQIFSFQNANEGVKRVHGIRDYQKEIVYWCYADADTQAAPGVPTSFPNKVLLYNYRNNTWAIFRDTVTTFGTLQISENLTWDSQDVTWDSNVVTWDDLDTQSRFPIVVAGNQQGFVSFYQYQGPQAAAPLINAIEQPSLAITGVAFANNQLSLTIPNHNLTTGEIIYISGMEFVDDVTFLAVATNLNDRIYRVRVTDVDTVVLAQWDFNIEDYFEVTSFTPDLTTSHYIGNGLVTLLPRLEVQLKDFNPFQTKGLQTKLSYTDFLMGVPNLFKIGDITGATAANPCVITSADHGLFTGQQVTIRGVQGMTQLNSSQAYRITVIDANSFSLNINSSSFAAYIGGGTWTLLNAGMTVNILLNSSPSISGNLLVGNKELKTTPTPSFYGPGSDYAWYRFYATCTGQFFNLLLTYDDNLMNTLTTHQQNWEMNAITMWVRPGGRTVF